MRRRSRPSWNSKDVGIMHGQPTFWYAHPIQILFFWHYFHAVNFNSYSFIWNTLNKVWYFLSVIYIHNRNISLRLLLPSDLFVYLDRLILIMVCYIFYSRLYSIINLDLFQISLCASFESFMQPRHCKPRLSNRRIIFSVFFSFISTRHLIDKGQIIGSMTPNTAWYLIDAFARFGNSANSNLYFDIRYKLSKTKR